MTNDKHTGKDPGIDFPLSPEDEAFLRMVEDSYEAVGQPKDQKQADQIWGKIEAQLSQETKPSSAGQATVHSIHSGKKRQPWIFLSTAIGVAAALLLFINIKPSEDLPGTMQTRGGEAGFAAEIKIYDKSPDGTLREMKAAPEHSQIHIVVKVQADADGHVALYRQQGESPPVFVANLVYKKGQGEMTLLEEDAEAGVKFCIVGAKDQDGLKHLADLIPELWAYLPVSSCQTIP